MFVKDQYKIITCTSPVSDLEYNKLLIPSFPHGCFFGGV